MTIPKAIILLFCSHLLINAATAEESNDIGLDTAKIEQLTGVKGKVDKKEKVLKITVPRDDLNVMINGVKITPAAGVASWVSFMKAGKDAMIMGDLALLQDQVNPILSTALENGINVTALHNHLLWESPRLMFMHIESIGDTDKLANAIGKIFEKIKSTKNEKSSLPDVSIDPAKSTIDTSKIDAILGQKGTLTDGVYKVVIGRTAKMHGYKIGSQMGINSWAAFMGSDDQAVMDGDLAAHESELQGILKALNNAGIYIVSIHQHMDFEKPRYIYVHFYGIGNVEALAQGLQAALEVSKVKR